MSSILFTPNIFSNVILPPHFRMIGRIYFALTGFASLFVSATLFVARLDEKL